MCKMHKIDENVSDFEYFKLDEWDAIHLVSTAAQNHHTFVLVRFFHSPNLFESLFDTLA